MALVAREGWAYIGAVVAVAAIVHHYLGGWVAAPIWLLAAIVVFFFRDPDRKIPSLPLAVLSPVDGVVLSADPVHDAYLEREALNIAVRMHGYGAYTVRSPVEGKVMQRWYSADSRKAGPGGEREGRYGIWVQTDEKDDVVIVMKGGPVWQRPRCYVQYGERVGQGQRCGFIHFGSCVDILVPSSTRLEVGRGDAVEAGTSPVGTLIHRTKP